MESLANPYFTSFGLGFRSDADLCELPEGKILQGHRQLLAESSTANSSQSSKTLCNKQTKSNQGNQSLRQRLPGCPCECPHLCGVAKLASHATACDLKGLSTMSWHGMDMDGQLSPWVCLSWEKWVPVDVKNHQFPRSCMQALNTANPLDLFDSTERGAAKILTFICVS